MGKILTISKWFIDKGFGNPDILTKRSVFPGFSKSLNGGIFFFAAINGKRMSDFDARVSSTNGGSLFGNIKSISLLEKISSENGCSYQLHY